MTSSSAEYKILTGPECIQRSDEWHEFRKGKIGASMVASICGVDPFRTRRQLWEDMLYDNVTIENAAMQRGRELEPFALSYFNVMHNANFQPVVIQSTIHPELIASLDGVILYNGEVTHLLEIKCPGKKVYDMCENGEIPIYYQYQM